MCLITHRMLEQGIFCLRYCSGIGRALLSIEKNCFIKEIWRINSSDLCLYLVIGGELKTIQAALLTLSSFCYLG
jgi:hypothetical protein